MSQTLSYFQKYLSIIFVFLSFSIQAQTLLRDIDTARIKQKSIRNFLKNQMGNGIVNFEDFRPSVNEQTDSSRFDSYKSHFCLQQAQDKAWKAYLTIHPAKVWNGKMVSYGFIYSPLQKSVIFSDDPYPGLEPREIFFIEFRFLSGLVHIPVCLCVTEINSIKHEISFSYVDGSPSDGSQTIRIENDGSKGISIIHSSIHKTRNILRDKIFYPIYHRKAISQVHRNIRKLINQGE